MSQVTLPQPPQSSLPAMRPVTKALAVNSRTAGNFRALDQQFLQRCLVVTPIVAIAFATALFAWLHSFYAAASYFAGALYGTVLLGTLILFVRRFTATKLKIAYSGWDAKIPLWLLAGAKYLSFIVVAWGVVSRGWAQPFAFVMGIALVQLVILTRALGRTLTSRSIAEIYVDNANR